MLDWRGPGGETSKPSTIIKRPAKPVSGADVRRVGAACFPGRQRKGKTSVMARRRVRLRDPRPGAAASFALGVEPFWPGVLVFFVGERGPRREFPAQRLCPSKDSPQATYPGSFHEARILPWKLIIGDPLADERRRRNRAWSGWVGQGDFLADQDPPLLAWIVVIVLECIALIVARDTSYQQLTIAILLSTVVLFVLLSLVEIVWRILEDAFDSDGKT